MVMLPMKEADVFNGEAEDDMMRTIRTGQIPDQLLQDILEEAGQFMDLFNHNPSSFLRRLAKFEIINIIDKSINPKPSNFSEKLMTKRKGLIKKKKRPEGIVSLTRPRFGKRFMGPFLEGPSLAIANLSRAIYLYIFQQNRNSRFPLARLTRPRFGKRR